MLRNPITGRLLVDLLLLQVLILVHVLSFGFHARGPLLKITMPRILLHHVNRAREGARACLRSPTPQDFFVLLTKMTTLSRRILTEGLRIPQS